MRCVVLCLVASLGGCVSPTIDIGLIEQSEAPREKDLVVPKAEKEVDAVELFGMIRGCTTKNEERRLYVLVNPLSNSETHNMWWVQREVKRHGEKFECRCQFGEESIGVGEYFAIVGVVTDRELAVGEILRGIPEKLTYSKLKIVKRSR